MRKLACSEPDDRIIAEASALVHALRIRATAIVGQPNSPTTVMSDNASSVALARLSSRHGANYPKEAAAVDVVFGYRAGRADNPSGKSFGVGDTGGPVLRSQLASARRRSDGSDRTRTPITRDRGALTDDAGSQSGSQTRQPVPHPTGQRCTLRPPV